MFIWYQNIPYPSLGTIDDQAVYFESFSCNIDHIKNFVEHIAQVFDFEDLTTFKSKIPNTFTCWQLKSISSQPNVMVAIFLSILEVIFGSSPAMLEIHSLVLRLMGLWRVRY